MTKKILIALIMLLGALAQAHAYSFEKNGIYYNIMSGDSTVSVTTRGQYYESCYTGQIVIPSRVSYNGKNYEVTQIGSSAFANDTELLSISLPNTIKVIEDKGYGYGAFQGCSGLTSIVVPNSVVHIGNSAFNNCKNLTNVSIGNHVTTIGVSAFDVIVSTL